MKKSCLVFEALIVVATLLAGVQLVAAQESAASTGPAVNLVVTVEARHGSDVPDITRDDVMVYEGRDRDRVTAWLPLQQDHAGLEFFILLDDSSGVSLGSQLEDIRQFINAQPPTTKIGVAYMANGIAQVVQNLTNDHALASKALRLPRGTPGASASPYFSLGDLIKRWPATDERREVLMITDGIDQYWGAVPTTAMSIRKSNKPNAPGSSFTAFTHLASDTTATVIGALTGDRIIFPNYPTRLVAKVTTLPVPLRRSRSLLIWRTLRAS